MKKILVLVAALAAVTSAGAATDQATAQQAMRDTCARQMESMQGKEMPMQGKEMPMQMGDARGGPMKMEGMDCPQDGKAKARAKRKPLHDHARIHKGQ
jgi:hypothetical protein